MDKLLTLYAWFACLLILVAIIMDIILIVKFRRYYRASGLGIVTCTLLSLVFIQAFGAMVHGATACLIILSKGGAGGEGAQFYINLLKDTGITWLTSSTLLHTIAITFLRIYSVSYGNRFLKFIKSKLNIALVMMKLWFVSIALTFVTLTSSTTTTFSVFYIGLFVTGVFAVISFFVTIDTSLNTSQCSPEGRGCCSNPIAPPPSSNNKKNSKRRTNEFHVVKNPRKTFTLFSGIVISFVIFSLPCSVPNLYFTLRGKHVTEQISLMVSLWLLVGVVFNSLWILMRMRSNVNDTTGFYAKWTVQKNKRDLVVHYDNKETQGYQVETRLNTNTHAHMELLHEDEIAPETENETICD